MMARRSLMGETLGAESRAFTLPRGQATELAVGYSEHGQAGGARLAQVRDEGFGAENRRTTAGGPGFDRIGAVGFGGAQDARSQLALMAIEIVGDGDHSLLVP